MDNPLDNRNPPLALDSFSLAYLQAKEAGKDSPPAEPAVRADPLATLPIDVEFEARWAEFIRSREDSALYGPSDKALAKLGYHWAILAFQTFASRIYPR